MKKHILLLVLTLLAIPLCTAVSAETTQNNNTTIEFDPFEESDGDLSSGAVTGEIYDPTEGYNRVMHVFNDKLYHYFLKPVAKSYNFIVPKPARVSVNRVFYNIAMPKRFINCLLQGKFTGAGTELGRFTINTTFGIFNIIYYIIRLSIFILLIYEFNNIRIIYFLNKNKTI